MIKKLIQFVTELLTLNNRKKSIYPASKLCNIDIKENTVCTPWRQCLAMFSQLTCKSEFQIVTRHDQKFSWVKNVFKISFPFIEKYRHYTVDLLDDPISTKARGNATRASQFISCLHLAITVTAKLIFFVKYVPVLQCIHSGMSIIYHFFSFT